MIYIVYIAHIVQNVNIYDGYMLDFQAKLDFFALLYLWSANKNVLQIDFYLVLFSS